MAKIPVGATIAQAYHFATSQYFSLLKLTWPLLVATVAGNLLIGTQLGAFTQGIRSRDFSAVTMAWPLLALIYLLMLVVTLMWFTGIYQYAMGRPEAGQRPVYFSLGKPMWRLLGAFLLMVLSLAGILLAYVIAIVIILYVFRLGLGAAHVSDNALKGIAIFDVALAFLVGYCGFILCAFRFGFLLFPATIAEDRIALFRSWTISHGNFWRIFVIVLALFLPLVILEMTGFYWLGLFPHFHAGMTPMQMQAAQQAASAAAFAKMRQYGYVIYPVGAFAALFINSLMAGAQSFAYRALTQERP
jgi:hypothetical protein